MRLNDYVKKRAMADQQSLSVKSPFGFSTEGYFLNSFQTHYSRIEIYTRYLGLPAFAPSTIIQIFVPATETGIYPLCDQEQPYGWNGKINEYTAELALWWAFEILTQDEADNFMKKHRPTVIFQYVDSNSFGAMTVQYLNDQWIITDQS